MEAIFHNVTRTNYVYFTREAPARGSQLNMMVSGSGTATIDNAIISFGEGEGLEKFSLREDGSRLYIPQGGKDYAVVSTERTTGELPVSFKAEQDGTYTLSFGCEGVEFSYLHLLDNVTGEDIDLLVPEPRSLSLSNEVEGSMTYTFNACTTDTPNRFRLVFEIK
jgi:hypothetical protein